MFLNFTKEFKIGFENRKWNYSISPIFWPVMNTRCRGVSIFKTLGVEMAFFGPSISPPSPRSSATLVSVSPTTKNPVQPSSRSRPRLKIQCNTRLGLAHDWKSSATLVSVSPSTENPWSRLKKQWKTPKNPRFSRPSTSRWHFLAPRPRPRHRDQVQPSSRSRPWLKIQCNPRLGLAHDWKSSATLVSVSPTTEHPVQTLVSVSPTTENPPECSWLFLTSDQKTSFTQFF